MTMKHILWVRHAKSSWKHPVGDQQRPLNSRGKRDAPMMAERLRQRQIPFDALISSPAKRALTTAGYFAESLGFDKTQIQQDPMLYHASEYDLSHCIQNLNPDWQRVILFGHNPSFTTFPQTLIGQPFNHMPTCGMVYLQFYVDDWAAIMPASGKLVFFDYPKNSVST